MSHMTTSCIIRMSHVPHKRPCQWNNVRPVLSVSLSLKGACARHESCIIRMSHASHKRPCKWNNVRLFLSFFFFLSFSLSLSLSLCICFECVVSHASALASTITFGVAVTPKSYVTGLNLTFGVAVRHDSFTRHMT